MNKALMALTAKMLPSNEYRYVMNTSRTVSFNPCSHTVTSTIIFSIFQMSKL